MREQRLPKRERGRGGVVGRARARSKLLAARDPHVKASTLTVAIAGCVAVLGLMNAAFAQGVGSGSAPGSGSGSGSAPVAGSTSPSSSSGLGGSAGGASGGGGVGGGAAPSGGVGALYGGSGPPKRSDPTPPTGAIAPNGTGAGRGDMSNPQGGTSTAEGTGNQSAAQSTTSNPAGSAVGVPH